MTKKIAIITGASRGIGKTVAMSLADRYHVILIARSEEKLNHLKSELESQGKSADYYAIDIANHIAVKSTVEDIINRFHKIDLLVNNAGILKLGTSDISVADINEVIGINLLGVIYMGNAVAQHMKNQKNGYIINISSMAGKRGLSSSGIYCASKFGVLGYNESLYKELLSYGVKVTAICPSTVSTDMTKHFPFEQELMIEPEDISRTIDYLLTLSGNASIPEALMQCTSFAMKENQAVIEKLLSTVNSH